MIRFLAKSFLLVMAILLSPLAARACNVPLFRYALERWQPDAYQFVVLYEASLANAAKLDELKNHAERAGCRANMSVECLDVTKVSLEDKEKLSRLYSIDRFPWLVVRAPGAQTDRALWSGPLSQAPISELLDSPARSEIARRILNGDSAVWVLLESGDPAADQAARERLETCLHRLQTTMKLPELTNSPKDKLLREEPPLLLIFSILGVSRHDSREAFFTQMLLHTEPDLAKRNEPTVFPVFGRGIALYALVGKGINDDTVTEAANLLVGACRCEIKKLNPGTDLLMSAEWEAAEPPGPELAVAAVAPPALSDMNRNLFLVIFTTLVLVAVVTAVIYLRRRDLA